MSSADGSPPRRRGLQWPVLLSLTAVWVLLWGDLSAANVVSGLAVSVFVVVVFPLPPIVFDGRIHLVGMLKLLGHFAVDLVIASGQVASHVLRLGRQPASAVIQVDLRSRSDLYLTLTAELLSLVPGSLVVEARRSTSTLFLHVLGVRDDSDVELARRRALEQERRVMYALASSAELAAYHRETQGDH